ncbi:MAG: phosphate ABC transporter ATP-binding protein [Oceanococcus sp.]
MNAEILPTSTSASTTMQTNAAPDVQLESVSVHYDQQVAIQDVSLHASGGEITALVGPSGCGKSSLLSAINRMSETIPGCTVRGDIKIGALDVMQDKLDTAALRRQVGMVFQNANPFPLSIAENILFPLRDHGLRNASELQDRLRDALQRTGLWDEVADRLKQPALRLSGGQQQRLCLARALALEPQVLLLDEPCSALDPVSTEKIEALLLGLKSKITMLMVTHNLGQARRIADHVAVCWLDSGCGCVVESGRVDSIFNNPVSPVVRDYCQGRAG